MSYGEWTAMHKRLRYRRTLTGFTIGLAIILAILVGVFHERFSLGRDHKALISAIDNLENYEVVTYALDRNGRKSGLLRDEIHEGRDWQLSLWGGKVVFSKIGSIFSTYEPGSNTLFRQGSWFGAADSLHRVRAALVGADPWQRGPSRFSELPRMGSVRRYLVLSDPERYEIEVDDQFRPLSVTLVRFTDDGWIPTEASHVSYEPRPRTYLGKPGMRTIDLTSTSPWDTLYTTVLTQLDLKKGFIMCVRRVEANPAGTVFIFADGLTPPTKISIMSSDGAHYLSTLMRVDPPDFDSADGYNVIMAARMDHTPVKWPLRLKIDVDDNVDKPLARFSETIDRPECDPIPFWFCGDSASDRPFFEYYRELDKLLGDYYSTVYYSHGMRLNLDSPEFKPGGPRNVADREKGLEFELASLDKYFQSAPNPNDAADAPYLAETWYAVYVDHREIDSQHMRLPKEEAIRALKLAADVVHRDDYRGPVSEKIAAAVNFDSVNASSQY